MIYKIFNREAIDLKYKSTRGNTQSMDSAEAIIAGLADDGGLFVPTGLPKVDGAFIEELTGCSYEERAKRVLSCFLTDYTPDEIAGCVGRAYGNKKFDNEKIAPVTMFDDVSVLELWHGVTYAFKDLSLSCTGQFLQYFLEKKQKHIHKASAVPLHQITNMLHQESRTWNYLG